MLAVGITDGPATVFYVPRGNMTCNKHDVLAKMPRSVSTTALICVSLFCCTVISMLIIIVIICNIGMILNQVHG
jgi:hypothetical protein